MDPIVAGTFGIGLMFVLIVLHVPIGVAMGLAGFIAIWALLGFDAALTLFGTEPTSTMTSAELAVIPLFLLMGSFAGAAGLSGDIYRVAYAFLGHYRGGLALATIGGCAGFGAVCGSSIATAATMARIALPEMLDRGYQPSLAVICVNIRNIWSVISLAAPCSLGIDLNSPKMMSKYGRSDSSM